MRLEMNEKRIYILKNPVSIRHHKCSNRQILVLFRIHYGLHKNTLTIRITGFQFKKTQNYIIIKETKEKTRF